MLISGSGTQFICILLCKELKAQLLSVSSVAAVPLVKSELFNDHSNNELRSLSMGCPAVFEESH